MDRQGGRFRRARRRLVGQRFRDSARAHGAVAAHALAMVHRPGLSHRC